MAGARPYGGQQQRRGRRGQVFSIRLTDDERQSIEQRMAIEGGPRFIGAWLRWVALAGSTPTSPAPVVPGQAGYYPRCATVPVVPARAGSTSRGSFSISAAGAAHGHSPTPKLATASSSSRSPIATCEPTSHRPSPCGASWQRRLATSSAWRATDTSRRATSRAGSSASPRASASSPSPARGGGLSRTPSDCSSDGSALRATSSSRATSATPGPSARRSGDRSDCPSAARTFGRVARDRSAPSAIPRRPDSAPGRIIGP